MKSLGAIGSSFVDRVVEDDVRLQKCELTNKSAVHYSCNEVLRAKSPWLGWNSDNFSNEVVVLRSFHAIALGS